MRTWIAAIVLMAGTAHAAADFTGTWTAQIDARNLFVVRVQNEKAGITGSVDFPNTSFYAAGEGLIINETPSGERREYISDARLDGAVLHVVLRPAPASPYGRPCSLKLEQASLRFTCASDPGALAQGFVLTRGQAGDKVSLNWMAHRLYLPGDSDRANPELQAIFEADQKDRITPPADFSVVVKADAERRRRTRELLDAGALHSGQDFENAAYVFQHGDTADDYLLAHVLATVAVSKGDQMAIWIAAATLDRYLNKVGRKQIFGTQYFRQDPGTPGALDPSRPWTQEPYDRSLIPDALRRCLMVPPQSAQAEELKRLQQEK